MRELCQSFVFLEDNPRESSRCPRHIFFPQGSQAPLSEGRWCLVAHTANFPVNVVWLLGKGLPEIHPKPPSLCRAVLVSTQSKCLGRKLAEYQGIILEVILVALKENDKLRESGKHFISNSLEFSFPWRTKTMTQTLADLLRPVNCAQSPSEAKRKAVYALRSSVHDVCCHIKCVWKCLHSVCYIFIVIFIFSLHDLYLFIFIFIFMQILFFFF